jgi:hypothetical protein
MADSKALTVMDRITALERAPLQGVQQLRETLESLREHAFILCPVSMVDAVQPLHRVSLRAVKIDTTYDSVSGNGPEVYHSPLFHRGPDDVSLGKVGIAKLMAAAGAVVIQKRRVDDRSDPHYCEMEVWVAVQDFDGSYRNGCGTAACDFRKGSSQLNLGQKAMSDSQINALRRKIVERCETLALQRGLRELLLIQHKYKTGDLKAKPFVIPKLVKHYDLTDPDQKRQAFKEAENEETRLFGGRQLQAPDTEVSSEPEELHAPPPLKPAVQPAAPAAEPPAAEAPPAEADSADEYDDFEAEAEGPPPVVCPCPCGCTTSLTQKAVEVTTERIGAPRCLDCYPGGKFNFERHQHLKTLGIPKAPGMTAERVMEQLKRGR